MTLAAEHPREYPTGSSSLAPDEIEELARMVPAWDPSDEALARTFSFKDFQQSFAFVTRVALLAEAEGHHPDILISWSRVELRFWTHTAQGLTRNDFIMAAKIDTISVS